MTAPLRDTQRIVTVVPEQFIQDRGVSTLADVLRITSGNTLGADEGGTRRATGHLFGAMNPAMIL